MSKICFMACKQLDFSESYRPGCRRQILASGKLFWLRPDYHDDRPRMVQFCKRLGRLNIPEACLDEENKMCSAYEEARHEIEMKEGEL